MSVFRAPYERMFYSLGAILDREEVILSGRTDPLADEAAQQVLAARIAWIGKGRELEPRIARLERWIWLAVAFSGLGLAASALWPALELSRPSAVALLIVCLGPLGYGSARIGWVARDALTTVRSEIEAI